MSAPLPSPLAELGLTPLAFLWLSLLDLELRTPTPSRCRSRRRLVGRDCVHRGPRGAGMSPEWTENPWSSRLR
eukprot:7195398-Heterocapsa_arctica.AAC.1